MATAEEARAGRDAKLDALHEQLTGAVESLVSGEDWKQAGPSPRIVDTVVVDYAAVGSVAARWAS